MKVLVNRKIKRLFGSILLCILFFTLTAALLMGVEVRNAAVYAIVCFLLMGTAILALLSGYFMEQHKIMEDAISQITEYISGNRDVTMECNDEGELYRLFHEVNSLVAILDAHAEKEKRAKIFLKNTISDISHQLKTPLAALNIYIGLIQDEAEGMETIREFSRLSEQELDRIETLVQNLLKITKLDAGMIVPQKSLENVSEMAESVKKHFQFRAPLQKGDIIQVEGENLTVAGMLKSDLFSEDGLSHGRVSVIASSETFVRLTGITDYSVVMVQTTGDVTDEDVAAINEVLGEGVVLRDERELSTSGTYTAFVLCVYGFLAIIAMVTLLNIMNSISMSVSARSRQYGAMRAVGMDDRQVTKMIAAEAVTYAVSGCVIGCIVGLAVGRMLYDLLIDGRFPYAVWTMPVSRLLIVLAFVAAATLAAIYAPAKRIRSMAITATINEL